MTDPISIKSHKRATSSFLFRIFLESNLLLSLGFVLSLVIKTLWILGRSQAFSFESTPILFRNLIWAFFAISLFCFLSYFGAFYLFVLAKQIPWTQVKKTFILVAIMTIFTIAVTQLSIIKISFPPALSTIDNDRMFVYFFPCIILFAFLGITGATTFFVNLKRAKLVKSNPKAINSTGEKS